MTSTDAVRAAETSLTETQEALFPPGFVWGAATAAYQIEGAAREDGRTPSIWDTFSHTPGKVVDGDTGDVATDHYHRAAEDVSIMADLGLNAYRFSVAWSRVIPGGSGAVNQRGVDFYSRLVDDLLRHDITPLVTLYHWDLPQELQDRGGWTSRDTVARFADFAREVGQALGDRVGSFTTLNEPWCSAFLGHATGVHAPGVTDDTAALVAAHHLNLAHGASSTALRSVLPRGTQISLTVNPSHVRAASSSPADLDAARAVDAITNRIFLDPVLKGSYPADLFADTAHLTDWSFVRDDDLGVIHARPDVLGVNYYTPALVAAAESSDPEAVQRTWRNDPLAAEGLTRWPGSDRAVNVPQDGPQTSMGWRIEAESLTELLVDLHQRYPGVPMMITENGAAFTDVLEEDGTVHDVDRIAYLDGHVRAVHAAIAQQVDVRGFFVWSLLDNFEWAWGYSKRFGLVHVDFASLRRTPKESARWYRRVIAANGLVGGSEDPAGP
jgi:beta-glucosidase